MILNDPRFTKDMVAACMAAMDSGLIYIPDIKKFVMDAIAFSPVQTHYLGEVLIDVASHEDFYGVQGRLQERIASLPRGTYATGKLTMADEEPTFRAYMSDGHGLAPGVKDQIFRARPTVEEVLDRMLTCEIIECKKAIEQERRRLMNIAILTELHLRREQKFDTYYARGVKYACATVNAIDMARGTVSLTLEPLTNRHATGNSDVTLDAADFVSNAGIQTQTMLAQRKKDFPLIVNAQSALTVDLAERAMAPATTNNLPN